MAPNPTARELFLEAVRKDLDRRGNTLVAKTVEPRHMNRIKGNNVIRTREGREFLLQIEGDKSYFDVKLGGTATKRKRDVFEEDAEGDMAVDEDEAWEDEVQEASRQTDRTHRTAPNSRRGRRIPVATINRRGANTSAAASTSRRTTTAAARAVVMTNGVRRTKRVRTGTAGKSDITPTPAGDKDELGPSCNTRSRAAAAKDKGKGKATDPDVKADLEKITAGIDCFSVVSRGMKQAGPSGAAGLGVDADSTAMSGTPVPVDFPGSRAPSHA